MRTALLAGATLAMTVGQALAGVKYGGVNIAGFDFGCETTVKIIVPLDMIHGLMWIGRMRYDKSSPTSP